jgi:site-specific recombinase XerD
MSQRRARLASHPRIRPALPHGAGDRPPLDEDCGAIAYALASFAAARTCADLGRELHALVGLKVSAAERARIAAGYAVRWRELAGALERLDGQTSERSDVSGRDGAAQHPVAVYLARLAPGSRRTMGAALDLIARLVEAEQTARTLPWARLRYQHTQAIRAALAARFAPATANKMLCALRGVLREAQRLGQLSAEEYQRAADLASVRGARLPAGRALTADEMRALFAACDGRTLAGTRDRALLAVLRGCGLRRAELVALDVAHVAPADPGALALRVPGKGNKHRVVYLAGAGQQALAAWLRARGEAPGALFGAVNKAGRLEARRLTPQAVAYILGVLAKRAGVAKCSPHDARRSFISDLLDAGADLATVQQLAGHASVATTTRYDRRGERAKRRAVDLVRLPIDGAAGALDHGAFGGGTPRATGPAPRPRAPARTP